MASDEGKQVVESQVVTSTDVIAKDQATTDLSNFDISIIPLPSRDTAPFIYDVGSRVLTGAFVGFVAGLVFFKRSGSRRFTTYYGAGVGLGMSYSQISFLYGKLIGEQEKVNGEEILQDLEKELALRKTVQL
ncbi:hypothetical protein FGO68_gene10679 [Halteria grandinella]|uniref:Uncharacterized protein n=1 Tax=Halteria grandinella TaxID=5974 RepID=A0A8J8NIF6_HALGN|nr:hypothetical protein FGO68_gene10679 [Halteria grandinella]